MWPINPVHHPGTIYVNNDEWPKTTEEVKTFMEEHYDTAIPLLGGIDSIADQLLNKGAGILGEILNGCHII